MRRRSLLKSGKIDYSKEYFTIVSLADSNTIGWKCNTSSSSYLRSIYISTDNGATWTAKQSTSGGTTLATLNNGDKMLVKYHSATSYGDNSYINRFTSTEDFDVEGNIMSMIINGDFTTATTISSTYTFRGLFLSCTKLNSAINLVLPATTLADSCYDSMFYGCSALTTAPSLPATTLALRCYHYMFYNCTSLTTAPSLPATTLASSCYSYMFYGCSALTTAPSLPATTLADYCYQYMFYGCTNLTTAPSTLPATTLVGSCYAYMFQNCTSLTTAPSLPATTLVSYCYYQMFYNCSNLNSITCLATNPSTSYCTTWTYGVASSGTFYKNSSATWTTGYSGIPSGWSVQDAT